MRNLFARFRGSKRVLPLSFTEKVQRGYYMGILESYGVSWELPIICRDTLQNFFDEKLTLEGTNIEVVRGPRTKRWWTIISGNAQYDWRKLVHLGGSDKTEDDTTAGGFGEGAKVLSLCLLRDYKFKFVGFGSGNWRLRFSLQPLKSDHYDKKTRGLFAQLSFSDTYVDGNFVMLCSDKKEYAEQFQGSRDLFYRSDHPDFLLPTAEVVNRKKKTRTEERIGFRFLGVKQYGRVYDAGQRRQYLNSSGNSHAPDAWQAVEGLNLWRLGGKSFSIDRDRGPITHGDMNSLLLKPLAEALSPKQLHYSIYEMEPIWDVDSCNEHEAHRLLLENLLHQASARKVPFAFDKKYVCKDGWYPSGMIEAVRDKGYVVCHYSFRFLGMKGIKSVLGAIGVEFRVNPTTAEKRKIEILKQGAALLNKVSGDRKYVAKPVYLHEKENSPIDGQYDNDFVWLHRRVLNKSFGYALATYLHELDHRYGSDLSSSFSYALTTTLEMLIKLAVKEPLNLKKLEQQFESIT